MEDRKTVINQFNRAGAFYPLIVSYLVLLHGFIELTSRHSLALARALPETVEEGGPNGRRYLYEAGELEVPQERLIQFYRDPVNRHATPLIRPLQLKSEAQGSRIDVDADALAAELFQNFPSLAPWTINAGGILLISAWERTRSLSDKGTMWEFLRHCRNAASHGARFNFKGGEPKLPAAWGPFELERSMHGSPLFKRADGAGLLSPGDPIRLLWDLEHAHPELRVIADLPDNPSNLAS